MSEATNAHDEAARVVVAGSGARRVDLPQVGPPFERASTETLDAFRDVSAATAVQTLHKMGLARAYMQGPRPLATGMRAVGSALTLAFMPKREDISGAEGQEHFEKHTALWEVLDHIEPHDILVVQAFGDPYTGCLGEMLVNYLHKRGGVGVVVDGCIRDWPKVRLSGAPVWARGVTPHYATQAGLIPWAYQVPVSCAGVLVLPGDVVVADDDGAVVVPAQLAAETARLATSHEQWEVFSRERLAEGGALKKYYPLNEEATREYELWKQQRS